LRARRPRGGCYAELPITLRRSARTRALRERRQFGAFAVVNAAVRSVVRFTGRSTV